MPAFFVVILITVAWLVFIIVIILANRFERAQRVVDLGLRSRLLFIGIYTYFLPTVGNALFLTVINTLFSAMACSETAPNGVAYLMADSHVSCWTTLHITMFVIAVITFVLYYPLAVIFLQFWQAVNLRLDFKLEGRFLVVLAQLKLLASFFNTFYKSEPVLIVMVIISIGLIMVAATLILRVRQAGHAAVVGGAV